jgi:membrane fusion protein, heavy metal efflux system
MKLKLFAALLLIAPLAACGGGADTGKEAGEKAEEAKGPHRGKMLRDGDFAIEMTVFEDGVPPQFRAYPYRDGKPVDPKTVKLTVTLKRLDGQVEVFSFLPENDYLVGQGTVVEPHSFDYEVVAVTGDKRHVWKYPSPEGQTKISA